MSEFHPYLPKRASLLREEFKVLSCERDRRKGLQAQPCPALEEAHQALKGVQAQSIISIVGQVGHKYADLQRGCLHVRVREPTPPHNQVW